jgi:indolepyruvate ferredoxin oxidoreductase
MFRRFGVNKKLKLGSWFRLPLRVMASMRFIRGTPLDVFGMSAHRRSERALIDWYKDVIRRTMDQLNGQNLATALEIAALPDQIRGYEKIKDQSIAEAKKTAVDKLKAMAGTLVQVR